MRLQHFIYSTLFTLGVGAVLTGCHDYTDEVAEVVANEAPIVLDLRIGTDVHATRAVSDRLTRALPMGGEDGDGREVGEDFENAVTDISLYYYQAPSGIASPDATPVRRMVYIDDLSTLEGVTQETVGEKIVKHIPLKRSMLDNYRYSYGDQFIVVANMGTVTAPTTLGALRNMLVSKAWTGTAGAAKSTYSKFVMSNERNSYYYERKGTKDEPHLITVDIERVAARLDFCSNGCDRLLGTGGDADSPLPGGNGEPCIEYTAHDGSDVGKVYVTHVRPFNVMKEPTYLIKRSALTSSETPVYLKNEVAYNGSEFAYVVEPHTWSKVAKPSNNTTDNLTAWYGDTRYAKVNADYANNFDYRVHVNKADDADGFNVGRGYSHVSKTEDLTNAFTNFYVLDYANENTMPEGATTHEVATGYIVRAYYKPNNVYQDADCTTPVSYSIGSIDLYRYRPLLTEFKESKCVYFTTKAVAEAYGAKFPAVPFVVEKFTNGICYYITYLRHDNGNDVTPFDPDITPMEYGIVRNNIYRLKCSFTGPGYNEIPPTPTFEPLGIKPYIFVRRWYQIEHPEINI